MTELLTAAQMRAIEQAAIESGEVTGLELMERAGRGVVEAIFEEWPELAKTDHRAVVLCGPGNNGGDGFVVARLLKEWGWEVEVFLYGDAEKLPADAKVNCERWRALGEVQPITDIAMTLYFSNKSFPKTSVVVDALFGAGINRAIANLDGLVYDIHVCAEVFDGVQSGTRIVSVDVPSSMNADTGLCFGDDPNIPLDDVIVANLTVTFHQLYQGHVLNDGPNACGKVVIKDIGLTNWSQAPHQEA